MKFQLKSSFKPTGDQPEAIKKLVCGIQTKQKHQVLLGVTGSGKTFTIANVIEKLNWPVLVISHNKTLAAQLYQEFRDFFPDNAVSFFVSYYDYYQPEAYIPQTDTYIEKATQINDLIDKLRLRATTNLLTRADTLTVASVSCIYNIGSPQEYGHYVLELRQGEKIDRQDLFRKLTKLQYERADYGFHRGTFRVRGEMIDIFPAYEDWAIRMITENDQITQIIKIDPLSGKNVEMLEEVTLYPAKHYLTNSTKNQEVFRQIRQDLRQRLAFFRQKNKEVEAYRLERKVNYDLEMMVEMGYVNGIENYSRYFDGRKPGDPPYTLIDYYRQTYHDQWLLVIDESHMTIPQINGMYLGDRSRKKTLIDFGFRLPAALDNRPLTFTEFQRQMPYVLYTSATPGPWELSIAKNQVVEQLIRPTGLPDPEIDIRPIEGQVEDLISEIEKRAKAKERILVTTLTKRMTEELADYLANKNIRVHYLHSEIETLDRLDIIDDLRAGKYDVLVGINLLREGLDLPEVSLVAILDADKEGFLRSETSLIQVMGRAARHLHGKVIMYADQTTGSMQRAISEVQRRRQIQLDYNQKHHLIPKSIKKPIRPKVIERVVESPKQKAWLFGVKEYESILSDLKDLDFRQLTPEDKVKLKKRLLREMKAAARDLNFELAASIRDRIEEINH